MICQWVLNLSVFLSTTPTTEPLARVSRVVGGALGNLVPSGGVLPQRELAEGWILGDGGEIDD